MSEILPSCCCSAPLPSTDVGGRGHSTPQLGNLCRTWPEWYYTGAYRRLYGWGGWGRLFWCDTIIQKEVSYGIFNVVRHGDPTTNHAKALSDDHCGFETFFGIGDYNILDVIHKVHLEKDNKAEHVLDPDVESQIDPRLPGRIVTTLTTRFNTLKYKVECLRGRQNFLGAQNILRVRIVFILNHNTLTK